MRVTPLCLFRTSHTPTPCHALQVYRVRFKKPLTPVEKLLGGKAGEGGGLVEALVHAVAQRVVGGVMNDAHPSLPNAFAPAFPSNMQAAPLGKNASIKA